MKMHQRLGILSLGVLSIFAMSPAWASSDLGNLPDILMANLNVAGDIMQTIAVLMGLGLFIGGIFQLKRYGEMRTMMSSQLSIAGPMMTMIAGVGLLCSPLFMGTLLVSFWGTGGAADLPYAGDTTSGWAQFVQPVLMLVRLVGVYAFMRGFVMAARTGSGHAQQGTIGKILLHLFGGILCVHIVGTMSLIENILGFNFSL
jgi:intracellular multiplication protein IcmC